MARNIIFFAWTRAIPGREKISAQHFEEFVQYLTGLQRSDAIDGFDTVFLDAHGGRVNGFFLIRGESDKLDALMASPEWATHIVRAGLHLEGAGAVRGVAGDDAMHRMAIWTKHLPEY